MVWVNVVLSRTVVVDSDWRFDNLSGSHLQSQRELYHVSWWYYTLVIDLIYSGLHSPRRSNSTYFWNDSWVQTFHNNNYNDDDDDDDDKGDGDGDGDGDDDDDDDDDDE